MSKLVDKLVVDAKAQLRQLVCTYLCSKNKSKTTMGDIVWLYCIKVDTDIEGIEVSIPIGNILKDEEIEQEIKCTLKDLGYYEEYIVDLFGRTKVYSSKESYDKDAHNRKVRQNIAAVINGASLIEIICVIVLECVDKGVSDLVLITIIIQMFIGMDILCRNRCREKEEI